MGMHARVWHASVAGKYQSHVQYIVLLKQGLGLLLRLRSCGHVLGRARLTNLFL